MMCNVFLFPSHQEQEVCKREQAAKEKEWEKLNQMEQNNLQLEATIAELERYCSCWLFTCFPNKRNGLLDLTRGLAPR
jgi:uncharacterized protein (DUF3084 family)